MVTASGRYKPRFRFSARVARTEGRTLEREGGIPVIIMGLGEVGRAIALAALARPELEVVGAVDPSPRLSGRTLSDVLGAPAPAITVAADATRLLKSARGGVVLHATGSRFDDVL